MAAQKGTCEQGERSDLTGCTPASGDVSVKKPSSQVGASDLGNINESQIVKLSKQDASKIQELAKTWFAGKSEPEVKKAIEHLDELVGQFFLDNDHKWKLRITAQSLATKLGIMLKGDKKTSTPKKSKGTKYTMNELSAASKKAGVSMFGSSDKPGGLVWDPPSEIEQVKLSDLQKPDEDMGGDYPYVDDFEYVFFPSTGKGIDVSSTEWRDADSSWQDKDGKIYTMWDDTVRVVDVDKPLKKSRHPIKHPKIKPSKLKSL